MAIRMSGLGASSQVPGEQELETAVKTQRPTSAKSLRNSTRKGKATGKSSHPIGAMSRKGHSYRLQGCPLPPPSPWCTGGDTAQRRKSCSADLTWGVPQQCPSHENGEGSLRSPSQGGIWSLFAVRSCRRNPRR